MVFRLFIAAKAVHGSSSPLLNAVAVMQLKAMVSSSHLPQVEMGTQLKDTMS